MFHLPYFRAAMSVHTDGRRVTYRSARRSAVNAQFLSSYEPIGSSSPAVPGTLEYCLTERYCLYTATRSSAFRAEIHHPRWPLQDGEARIERNTMAAASGILLPETAPLVHYSKRQDVLVWPLRRVR